jgi:hypothetical protein
LQRGQSPEAAAMVALNLDSHRSQKNTGTSFVRWRHWPSRGTTVVPFVLCVQTFMRGSAAAIESLSRSGQVAKSEARRSRGWAGTGAPGAQEDFEIETAGTVLLRSEICMCFTPSLVYELTCARHSTPG